MSWLLLLVAPAFAGEYRRLELADGRKVAVEVLASTADGLEVSVPQGRMRLPYEAVASITAMSPADWAALPPLRILVLPVVAEPTALPADAQAADLQLRAELGALPRTTVLQLGETDIPADAAAQLRACGADLACVGAASGALPVDVTLLPGLVSGPALSVSATWRGVADAHATVTLPFAADPEARRVATSNAVHDALGLEHPAAPLAPVVTAAATAASPWTVMGVEEPVVATLPTPASTGPSTSDTPWGAAPAAPASAPGVTTQGPAATTTPTSATAPTAPATTPPAAATPPAATPPAGTPPDAATPAATAPKARRTGEVSPALAFVPLPGFPEWVAGDAGHGLAATALVVPGTAAMVYASGASTSRKGEFLLLSGIGYYSLCVATSRAFLPVVTPTAGGAALQIAGAW